MYPTAIERGHLDYIDMREEMIPEGRLREFGGHQSISGLLQLWAQDLVTQCSCCKLSLKLSMEALQHGIAF